MFNFAHTNSPWLASLQTIQKMLLIFLVNCWRTLICGTYPVLLLHWNCCYRPLSLVSWWFSWKIFHLPFSCCQSSNFQYLSCLNYYFHAAEAIVFALSPQWSAAHHPFFSSGYHLVSLYCPFQGFHALSRCWTNRNLPSQRWHSSRPCYHLEDSIW